MFVIIGRVKFTSPKQSSKSGFISSSRIHLWLRRGLRTVLRVVALLRLVLVARLGVLCRRGGGRRVTGRRGGVGRRHLHGPDRGPGRDAWKGEL